MNPVNPFQQLIDFANRPRGHRRPPAMVGRRSKSLGPLPADTCLVSPWGLTPRMAEVYDLYCTGMRQIDIAAKLGVSFSAIGCNLKGSEKRIAAGSRAACVAAWKKFRRIA